jgi:hypothetical protein
MTNRLNGFNLGGMQRYMVDGRESGDQRRGLQLAIQPLDAPDWIATGCVTKGYNDHVGEWTGIGAKRR